MSQAGFGGKQLYHATRRRAAAGLSLVELMITLAVGVILLTIATPSFVNMAQNNRAATQTNELLSALHIARSEAATRGVPVSVCASANALTCATAGDWPKGWIVFTDAAGAAGSVDAGDAVLRSSPALEGGATLGAKRGVTPISFVRYFPLGFLDSPANVQFELRIPKCQSDNNRDVTITTAGKPEITHVACS